MQPFVESRGQAWAETDLAGLQKTDTQPELNADKGDKAGPVSIAVAVCTPAPPDDPKPDAIENASADPSRGDRRFRLREQCLRRYRRQHRPLPEHVNWLTAQENLISIRPKEPGNSRLTITPAEMNFVWWFSVAGVPAAIFAIGIFTWSRRRRS